MKPFASVAPIRGYPTARFRPQERQRLVYLVLGRHDAHESPPAVENHGTRLGLVRRDPKRAQRQRFTPVMPPKRSE